LVISAYHARTKKNRAGARLFAGRIGHPVGSVQLATAAFLTAFLAACFFTCFLAGVVTAAGSAAVGVAGAAGVAAKDKLEPKTPAAMHRAVILDFMMVPRKGLVELPKGWFVTN